MTTVTLKGSYTGEWVLANAREYFVLAILNHYLPRYFSNLRVWAAPVGHGAVNPGLVEGWHRGASDKFDIAVMVEGRPCCYVEVTGVDYEVQLEKPELGLSTDDYCVGSWKLEDARRHRLLDKTWFAFVVMDKKIIRVLYARYLDYLVEHPAVKKRVLRRGEGPSYCLNRKHYWKPLRELLKWISQKGYAYALLER